MEKYKVEFNRKPLDKNEPSNQPDFQKFMSGKTPGGKGGWMLKAGMITAVVGVIATILFFLPEEKSTTPVTTAFVKLPLAGADVPFTEYTINPLRDTVIKVASGSEITVPRNAFLDEKGEIVSKPVTLRYRELRDFADFFLSGIPMTYDSAGTQYHFESAGMLEVLAFSEGKTLFANKDAQLKVAMSSFAPHGKFNIYYLDTISRNWQFVSKDTTSFQANEGKASEGTSEKTIQQTEKEIKPGKADNSQYVFEIEYDKKEFPELAAFDNVKFQVMKTQKDFDPSWSEQLWEEVQLSEGDEPMVYLVTFSNSKESHSFKATAVLDADEFNKAAKERNSRLDAYRTAANAKRAKEKRRADSLYRASESANTLAQEIEQMREVQNNGQQAVMRIFQISKFGIWNSDNPCALPSATQVIALFTDQSKKPLKLSCVYLGEKKRKVMFSYYESGFRQFRFDPEVDNIAAGVTLDNKLVLLESKGFKKLKFKHRVSGDSLEVTNAYKDNDLKSDTVRFVMKSVPFPVTDPGKLRQVLGI